MTILRLAKDLTMPPSAITETFALLAVRGAGKSNTGAVMAEEMFKARLPFVVIDPVRAWWGLRSSRDGKGPGLPIPIFGGKRGDVPLERGGGQLIADLIVDQRLSCVLDISEFESEAAKKQFLLDFARRLYQRNEEPLHLFLEEADDYIPQKPMKDELQLLRAWENIMRRGRGRGLGMTLITQRSAVLNKNVLTQAQTLIAMRTMGPQDVDAIEAWLKYHQQGKEILESLASLEDGEAWIWSPRFLKKTKRVRFRMRETFDSGATPKMNKEAKKPATLADVDLKAVKQKMEATIERAKAEDPRVLRARNQELERQLKARVVPAPAPAKFEMKMVEVPILKDAQVKQLTKATDKVAAILKRLIESSSSVKEAVNALETISHEIFTTSQANSIFKKELAGSYRAQIQALPAPRPFPIPPLPVKTSKAGSQRSSQDLIKGEFKILRELAARHPAGYSRSQVGALTGYTPSGGTFGNYFSNLKRQGLIEERGGLVYATQAGIQHLGTDIPPAPASHEEVMTMWQRALVSGAYRMLEVIVATGVHGVSRAALANAVDMTATGGTFGNYLSILRRNGLVTEQGGLIIATDILWP